MGTVMLKREYSHAGNLILVTPNHPLRYIPAAVNLALVAAGQPGIFLEQQAADKLFKLLSVLQCEDKIAAVSGFRTHEEQQEIWDDSLGENGFEYTKKYVAVPGHSEHQTGLAIDLAKNMPEIDFVCPEFPRNGICQRFRQLAPYLGFVERYLPGKEEITGIGAEPWHFRYVGLPHSIIMTKKNMVLEEYIEFLKKNTHLGRPYVYNAGKAAAVAYLSMEDADKKIIEIPECMACSVSGTNEGGFIITCGRY